MPGPPPSGSGDGFASTSSCSSSVAPCAVAPLPSASSSATGAGVITPRAVAGATARVANEVTTGAVVAGVADGATTGSELVDAEAAGALGGRGGAGSPGGHCGAGYAFEVVKAAPCESCDHFGVILSPHISGFRWISLRHLVACSSVVKLIKAQALVASHPLHLISTA